MQKDAVTEMGTVFEDVFNLGNVERVQVRRGEIFSNTEKNSSSLAKVVVMDVLCLCHFKVRFNDCQLNKKSVFRRLTASITTVSVLLTFFCEIERDSCSPLNKRTKFL